MIEVEGPDGVIYEFPEGTDDATMRNALMKVYGGQQSAPMAEPPQPERGLRQRFYDNIIGDPNDGVTSTGEALGTWLNRAGESATLGLVGDEASAAMTGMLPGRGYDTELARYRANEEGMSTAGRLTADLAGAVVPGFLGAGLVSGANSAVGALGRSALAGGAGGATYGFMEGEGGADERLADAGWSGGLGFGLGILGHTAANGIARGVGRLREGRAVREAVRGAPSTDDLRRMGNSAYQAIDDAGVSIRADRLRGGIGDIVTGMRGEGVGLAGADKVLPSSTAVADALAGVGEAANTVPWREADMIRRYLGNAAGSNLANKADTRVATQALGQFDDMIRALTPDDVDAGDVQALQDALPKAREIWTRMSRSQTIDDAIEASESYLGGQASGIRNQFARILRNPNMARSFSEVEKRAMRKAINGSIPQRLLNLAGGGLGQMATVGVGASAGGPAGAMAGAGIAGMAQRGAEAMSRRNAEVVRALIASGGISEAPQLSPIARALLESSVLGQAPQTADALQQTLR